ncbi:MAG: flagellar motor switch protein FliN [Anaerolineaceae bacterium]|nr:flagellar motor switch protein FliN [Anaerolineaceae bacterium]
MSGNPEMTNENITLGSERSELYDGAPRSKGKNPDGTSMELLMDVSLRVTVELGRTLMQLRQVLDLQQGSVVELERLAGDPVDVFINDRLMARGEVVVVDDKFGVRITELVSAGQNKGDS